MVKKGYTSTNYWTHQQYTILTPSAISRAGNKCNVLATISPVLELKDAQLPHYMWACIIITLRITRKRRERPGGSDARNIGASCLFLVMRFFWEANVSCAFKKKCINKWNKAHRHLNILSDIRMLCTLLLSGVNKCFKNLEAFSQCYAPERWHDTDHKIFESTGQI
jgi:hypothetical protein